jgi:hypothetical protein
MAQAHCMMDTYGYKHTLRICKTYCFSISIMVTRTRLKVTLYVHCLSCLTILCGIKNNHWTLEGRWIRNVPSRFLYQCRSRGRVDKWWQDNIQITSFGEGGDITKVTGPNCVNAGGGFGIRFQTSWIWRHFVTYVCQLTLHNCCPRRYTVHTVQLCTCYRLSA